MVNWKDTLGKMFDVEVPDDPPPKNNSYQTRKTHPSTSNSQPKSVFHGKPLPKNSLKSATAPYNFVALPEKILPAQSDMKNFREHIQTHGKLSGEILLTIETLTPLFVGGQGIKSFSPVGTPIIPGSSLRGMFKNLCKIVTCGAFRGRTTSQRKGEDFNDEHIYFRCLMASRSSPAWMHDLNKLYNGRMTHEVRGKDKRFYPVKNARPGFLIRTTDNKFFIAPAIADGKIMTNDRKDDRILIREYEEKFGVTIPERNSSCVKWDGDIAYIITGSQKFDRLYCKKCYETLTGEQKKKAGKQFIRFTRLDYLDRSRDHWIELPEDVRTSYEHDRNRRGVNLFKDKSFLTRAELKQLMGENFSYLLKQLDDKNFSDEFKKKGFLTRDELERFLGKKFSEVVSEAKGFLTRAELENLTGEKFPDVKSLIPCHFLEENGQITAFGHGQCFRIPYERRIGDAVPKNLRDEEIVDFADALFGKEKFWASRLYFEDATPENFSTLPETTAHPLMQPNPTSYQFYVTQNPADKLNHWDAGAQLRGYKLYWHKATADWHANNSELALDRGKSADKRLTKEMAPLDKGSKFTTKIRFKNLSRVELGALMMIFDLDGLTDAAYKIGQGKPFGFGSVKIYPKLFVEDADAYTKLFDADGWRNPCSEKNPADFVDAFKKYLATENFSATWQKVIDELKKILDWSQTKRPGWDAKVKSMSGDVSQRDGVDERFKQRVPLPTIFEVVK